jgi:hypothetical protein
MKLASHINKIESHKKIKCIPGEIITNDRAIN